MWLYFASGLRHWTMKNIGQKKNPSNAFPRQGLITDNASQYGISTISGITYMVDLSWAVVAIGFSWSFFWQQECGHVTQAWPSIWLHLPGPGINSWPKFSLSSGSKTKGHISRHDYNSREWGQVSETRRLWRCQQELRGELPALGHWLQPPELYSSLDAVSLPGISHSYVRRQIPFSCC